MSDKKLKRSCIISIEMFNDGVQVGWKFEQTNRGVPREIILPHLRAYLREQENKFFEEFEKDSTRYKEIK